MSKQVLVVAAHPDDETYGVGGTIARHVRDGDRVTVLIMTDGVTARHNVLEPQKEAARMACKTLGADVRFADLLDQKLDVTPLTEIIDPILSLVREIQPQIVYTHHRGDANQDHRRLFEATLVAVRPFGNNPVEQVFCYEVASSTDWGPAFIEWAFLPTVFVDIEPFVAQKQDAIEAYRKTHQSEVKPYPHPRAPEAMAIYNKQRGISVGMESAEAFMLMRQLVRD